MKILCLGHTSWDIGVPIDSFPIENAKYRLKKEYECGGGPAANAAYLLGKWNSEVYFAGVVGGDDFGQKIKQEFNEVKVDIHSMEVTYEHATPLSLVLFNKENGSRTIFNVASEYVHLKKLALDYIPDAILVDGHDYLASKMVLDKYPSVISVIDAGRYNDDVYTLAKMSKYIVCSKEFAEGLTKKQFDFNNKATFVEIYQELKNKFVKEKIIVVTLGSQGVLYCIDDNIKLMASIKVDTVDTTGAGDIFHGAFMYGLTNNFDLEKTIKFANIAAGLSVTKKGGRLSIPTFEEVQKYYEENK